MKFQAFPAYEKNSPRVPVWCVTPQHSGVIHRFFDTSPISPNGRYLAACVLPCENRHPLPGETAGILLVDLETGQEEIIAHTRGWAMQVGANLQWGDDQTLYYNDLFPERWEPCLVQLHPFTGEKKRLSGGIFMLSPDGRYALTHNLARSRLTQYGYGVMIPDEYLMHKNRDLWNDGFYRTDTQTGETELFMPLARLIDAALPHPEAYQAGEFYGFQCKWSPDQKRILYVVRWMPHANQPRRTVTFTSDANGENIHLALHDSQWARGGHHVNWHPDSSHITMNLRLDGPELRFVSFAYDGTDFHSLMEELPGSGHPSIHKNGRYLLTDAYFRHDKAYAREEGCTALRLVDLEKKTEQLPLWIKTDTGTESTDFRLDPHPAWDREGRYAVFNGYDGNERKVYLCDLSSLME